MLELLREEFRDKRVLILGYGIEGRTSHQLISSFDQIEEIGIADSRVFEVEEKNVSLHLGENYLESCSHYDLILKSPGISLPKEFWDKHRDKLTSQTELFLKYYPGTTVGITGTKGKTTTTSLLFHILQTAGVHSLLLGNIGTPIFSVLEELRGSETVVLELSSHQTQNIRYTPKISALLNVFPEHLEYYGSFEAYRDAKLSILQKRTDGGIAFIHKSLVGEIPMILKERELHIVTGDASPQINQGFLVGPHHQENLAFAAAIARHLGISQEAIVRAAQTFSLPPHRGEQLGKYHDIYWINDSASTIPQATIAALNTFPDTETLIVGGFNRGVDLSPLSEFLRKKPELQILCIPETGAAIQKVVPQAVLCDGLEEAVQKAKESTSPNRTCLFSPSAASYHLYKSYGERGEHFRNLVKEGSREHAQSEKD